MADLAALSNNLKESVASLNAELAAVERDLEVVDDVIEVEATIPIDQQQDQTYEARLAYGLYEGCRRLLVRSYQTDDPDTELEYVDGADEPLLEAAAPLRIAAV